MIRLKKYLKKKTKAIALFYFKKFSRIPVTEFLPFMIV